MLACRSQSLSGDGPLGLIVLVCLLRVGSRLRVVLCFFGTKLMLLVAVCVCVLAALRLDAVHGDGRNMEEPAQAETSIATVKDCIATLFALLATHLGDSGLECEGGMLMIYQGSLQVT